MDKTDRQALIGALYKAKAGGFAFKASGEGRKPVPEPAKVDRLVIGWPQIIPDTKRAPRWLKAPVEQPDQSLRIQRKERVSPLTKIAEQLPAKLPKVSDSAPTNARAYQHLPHSSCAPFQAKDTSGSLRP